MTEAGGGNNNNNNEATNSPESVYVYIYILYIINKMFTKITIEYS